MQVQRHADEHEAKEPSPLARPIQTPPNATGADRRPPPTVSSDAPRKTRQRPKARAAISLARSRNCAGTVARFEADSLAKQSPSVERRAAASASGVPAAPDARGAGTCSRRVGCGEGGDCRAASETVASEIVSPDPAVRWRIAGSVVQRSTDGGARWDAVPTGVASPLTAGAAPSASVCWVVGRGGVVLLSTDGRTWRRVAFPEMTDLSAVRPPTPVPRRCRPRTAGPSAPPTAAPPGSAARLQDF